MVYDDDRVSQYFKSRKIVKNREKSSRVTRIPIVTWTQYAKKSNNHLVTIWRLASSPGSHISSHIISCIIQPLSLSETLQTPSDHATLRIQNFPKIYRSRGCPCLDIIDPASLGGQSYLKPLTPTQTSSSSNPRQVVQNFHFRTFSEVLKTSRNRAKLLKTWNQRFVKL